jgi:hypothetical protein
MRNLGLYAGGDWSGKPDKPSGPIDIFSFAVAAFADLDVLNAQALELRRDLGMPLDEEFHGHEMSDAMNARVLEMGMQLEMRVGVLMVNKSAVSLRGRVALPDPGRFTHEIALHLLQRFVPLCPLQRLWCDEDIKGRAAQQSFETEVRQVSRAHHPASTCRADFRRSHTNVPVQVADVVAYVLSRQARGVRFGPPLQNALRKLRSSPQHLILGPVPWEE